MTRSPSFRFLMQITLLWCSLIKHQPCEPQIGQLSPTISNHFSSVREFIFLNFPIIFSSLPLIGILINNSAIQSLTYSTEPSWFSEHGSPFFSYSTEPEEKSMIVSDHKKRPLTRHNKNNPYVFLLWDKTSVSVESCLKSLHFLNRVMSWLKV